MIESVQLRRVGVIVTALMVFAACSSFREGPLDGAIDAAPSLAFTQNRVAAGAAFSCSFCTKFATTRPCCWGANAVGQLGTGPGPNSVGNDGKVTNPLKQVLAGSIDTKVVGVAAGGAHACAWVDKGAAACWGDNSHAQLGVGDSKSHLSDETVPLVDIGTFEVKGMSLGYSHSCAQSATGLRCWGSNSSGELGVGSTDADIGNESNELGNKLADSSVSGALLRVSTGRYATCMVTNDGKVACFGDPNASLGASVNDGRDPSKIGPKAKLLEFGAKVKSIALGYDHACVLLEDGVVKCWGKNDYGQLGDAEPPRGIATAANSSLPNVAIGTKSLAIAAGGDTTCVIVESGAIKCWGRNDHGQVGSGPRTADETSSNAVSQRLPFLLKGQRAVEIVVGGSHACAYVEGGSLYCWGANDKGQLGLDDATDVGLERDWSSNARAVKLQLE